jgi:hypothetical protein
MALDDKPVKLMLDERDLPIHWYNIVPDLPDPPSLTLCLPALILKVSAVAPWIMHP